MDDSPLRKMPPEIRNRLVELALRQEEVELKQQDGSTHSIRTGTASRKHPLALARTCKQVYAETYKIFYAVTEFTIHAPVPTFSYVVTDFLASLKPEAAEEIKHVSVRCDLGTLAPVVSSAIWRLTERNALQNPLGHALHQLQQPCAARIFLKLWYSQKKEAGWWQERVEETVIELDSGDLKRSWEEAKAKNEKLKKLGPKLDTDLDGCNILMSKLRMG